MTRNILSQSSVSLRRRLQLEGLLLTYIYHKRQSDRNYPRQESYVTPVFFKLLTHFWCLNVRERRQKSLGEVFKLSFTRFIQHRVQNLYKGKLQIILDGQLKFVV